MGYLSKETILEAYKQLSTLSDNPDAQGATQKVSIIRHFMALDSFFKAYKRNCDTRQSNDKREYAKHIGYICDVCPNSYTTNFYEPLKPHNGDYCVGSNFYSSGQVKVSLTNEGKIIDYPTRPGQAVLIKIQNGVLIRDISLYPNFNHYLSHDKFKVAIVLWILRKTNIDSNYAFESIYDAIGNIYTQELVDILFSNVDSFQQELEKYDLNLSEKVCIIDKDDITKLIKKTKSYPHSSPIQTIYFGSPGTGKSFAINELVNKNTEGEENPNCIRTTFHPDSDYSTFVGCYKPVKKAPTRNTEHKTLEELKAEAAEINSDENNGEKIDLWIDFVIKYARQITEIAEKDDKKSINNLLCNDLGFQNETFLAKIISITLESENAQSEITYEFCPQAFTQAYVTAWKTAADGTPYYLVIEEINRGNCAQIFGDIFQLLDRGPDGCSSYKATPDRDLQLYLAEAFEKTDGIPEDVRKGEKLQLPANLNILASMNTSDQSLFPIDSAFKRRWMWKYLPIHDEGYGHKIKLSDREIDWYKFLEAVNPKIGEATGSEDKQIGYWFIKDEEINAETFVSKVLFYLWNDVYKDFGDGAGSVFYFDDRNHSFRSFYKNDGDIDEDLLKKFFDGLGVSSDSAGDVSQTGD